MRSDRTNQRYSFLNWLKGFGGREESNSGGIFVTDARLKKDIAEYLAQDENSKIREQLFTEYFSTAIDHESGSAKEKSLHGIELVVPCRLYFEIAVNEEYVTKPFEPKCQLIGWICRDGVGIVHFFSFNTNHHPSILSRSGSPNSYAAFENIKKFLEQNG